MDTTIKIKLIQPTTQKLQFVKLLKACSNLGLKDSKDICDNLHNYPLISRSVSIRQSEIDQRGNKIDYKWQFIKGLNEINGKFIVTGDTQWERNVKVLKLGLGEESDYVNFIKDYVFDNFGDSENVLKFALSQLSKEQLEKVFNQINTEN